MFHVGQKVVCIERPEDKYYLKYTPNRPVERGVYHVRSIETLDDTVGLCLCEIINPTFEWSNVPRSEQSFHAQFFRPIIEKKTDISIFTAMLTPSPARSRELCGND